MDIIHDFNEIIKSKNIDWEILGLLSKHNNIHTLGSDSKIIGRIFEILVEPIIQEIANKHKLILMTPESQTIYPDFVLMSDKNDPKKIAIDVKSTYRRTPTAKIKYALGSYASYMRNNTKNIVFPYDTFEKHYVIGFIYSRIAKAQQSNIFSYEDKDKITSPYNEVLVFIQEKYKISGEKPGSGNTENLGSMSTNKFEHFVRGNGPFSVLGQEIYEHYWKNYPKYRDSNKESLYTDLISYFDWLENQKTTFLVKELRSNYFKWRESFYERV